MAQENQKRPEMTTEQFLILILNNQTSLLRGLGILLRNNGNGTSVAVGDKLRELAVVSESVLEGLNNAKK